MHTPSPRSVASWFVLALSVSASACAVGAEDAQGEESVASTEEPMVIGKDERVLADATDPEFRTVVRLDISRRDGDAFCSGTLVGERHVLTAGHCVYDPASGGYAKRIVVTPAATHGKAPYGTARAKSFVAHPNWVRGKDAGHANRGFDLALVELPKSFHIGYVDMKAASDDALEHGKLSVAGYPGDLGGRDMYVASGSLIPGATVMPDVLIHTVDTFGGDSGAGMRLDGRLVGLHVAHEDGLFAHNTGMRLTSKKVKWLRKLVEEGV